MVLYPARPGGRRADPRHGELAPLHGEPRPAWLLQRVGVFSVYREGMDREALKCAIQILADAQRPLVLFPEGVISRSNDRLNHLMDGTVFIARNAAKQRAEQTPPGKVVVHPMAIRYFFLGDLEPAHRAGARRDRASLVVAGRSRAGRSRIGSSRSGRRC